MPLTDVQIRKAKPAEKPFKLVDGQGLYLHVTPAGGKHWRMRYELPGRKEKLLTFGPYPAVSLGEAREKRDEAKRQLREGLDPAEEKKVRRGAAPGAPTFEQVARDWHRVKADSLTPYYAAQVLRSLEADILPILGPIAIGELGAPQILAALREIEERGAIEQAHRVRRRVQDVFTYAAACGLVQSNPAAGMSRALRKVSKSQQPAVTTLPDLLALIRLVEAEEAYPVTRLALRLLMLTAQRPGEIASARFEEFEGLDGDEPLWRIPAERMKMKREHWVPLSRQAADVVRAARPETSRRSLLFPNVRQPAKPISPNAMGYLLNRAGYLHRHVPHGFRASFSTIMNELHRPDRHVIDLMLSHGPSDKVEGAYNRAQHLDRRREIAQEWADLISPAMIPVGELVELRRTTRAAA